MSTFEGETLEAQSLIELVNLLCNPSELGSILLPIANSLIINNKSGAAVEATRIDIGYGQVEFNNFQRILDQMRYSKFEDHKKMKVVKCDDGLFIHESRNYLIDDSNGMCGELAIKVAIWLQIMYPKKEFIVGQDFNRPSGWNHYFVIYKQQGKEDYIIDPSKNKQGYLSETGKWDRTGVNYALDNELSISDLQRLENTTQMEIKHGRCVLPLISPRHFDMVCNVEPFGISLVFEIQLPYPYIKVDKCRGQVFKYSLDDDLNPILLKAIFASESIDLPMKFFEDVCELWSYLSKNISTFPGSLETLKLIIAQPKKF